MIHKHFIYKTLMAFILACLSFASNAAVEKQSSNSNTSEWMALSEQAVKTKLGRELRFSERIGLRLAQRQVRRHIQKMKRQANECTRIVLKDGSIIEASWFEMSKHIMEYKDCKSDAEVIRTVRMNDILSIVDVSGNVIYRDGRYLEPEEAETFNTRRLGIMSIVLGIASLVFLYFNPLSSMSFALATLGAILGIAGFYRHRKSLRKTQVDLTLIIGLALCSIPLLYFLFFMFFDFMLLGMF